MYLFWKKYDHCIGECYSFNDLEQFIIFTLSTNVSCITARCYVVERRPKDQVSQSVALSLRTSIEAEIFNGQLIPLFFGSSINISCTSIVTSWLWLSWYLTLIVRTGSYSAGSRVLLPDLVYLFWYHYSWHVVLHFVF